MDHPVTFAHAARQLLLLKIHYPDDVRHFHIAAQVKAALGGHPDLGKYMPPNAVNLRKRKQARERRWEHPPQQPLEFLGVYRLHHFVLAYDPLRRQYLS